MRSGSARRTTRSSSALAMTRTRSPSASSSLNITTSPTFSNSSAATTLSASLSMTSWPRDRWSRSTLGLTLTRSLRPPVNTSIESSSLRLQEGAEAGRRLGQPVDLLLELHDLVAGLAQGLARGARSARSAPASERWASASRSSRPREPGGLRSTGAGGPRPRPPGTGPGSASSRGGATPRAGYAIRCRHQRHLLCLRPYPRHPATGVVIARSWSRFGRCWVVGRGAEERRLVTNRRNRPRICGW